MKSLSRPLSIAAVAASFCVGAFAGPAAPKAMSTPAGVRYVAVEGAAARTARPGKLVFSTFSRSLPTPYYVGAGYTIAGPASDTSTQFIASPFVPSTSVTLPSINVPLENHAGTVPSADPGVMVQLYADNAGVPGALLGSWSVPHIGLDVGGISGDPSWSLSYVTVSTSASAIALVSGVQYWVAVVTSAASAFHGTWPLTSDQMEGTIAYSTDGGASWATTPWTAPALAVYGK